GPGNTLWVTLIKKEESGVPISAIARVTGLEPPVPPAPPTTTGGGGPVRVTEKPVPDTQFGKGPKKVVKAIGGKATVKFTFSSSVAGSTFQCKLTKVTPGKKKAAKASKGSFAGC